MVWYTCCHNKQYSWLYCQCASCVVRTELRKHKSATDDERSSRWSVCRKQHDEDEIVKKTCKHASLSQPGGQDQGKNHFSQPFSSVSPRFLDSIENSALLPFQKNSSTWSDETDEQRETERETAESSAAGAKRKIATIIILLGNENEGDERKVSSFCCQT